uniref:Retrotransposon gag domain-containing protein n=1 Tax=Nicotiana tabacum TaxID=4097 RepID=A0A1S4BQJ1_TOBAC|nr:PREDICTED: uncharacterized protein LOC107810833 [Nicotiana tabacum]
MEHQLEDDNNPLQIPPPADVEEQFDEVVPRPANRILRDYARPDRFNCESSVRKPLVAANNFEIRTGLIQTIQQSCIFTVYQAWERLKTMLRKCPHHDIPEHMQLYIFYHGLKPSSRNVIDAVAGGSIMGKTTKEALQLLNEISKNVNTQQPSQCEACDLCGGNHLNHECQTTNQNDEQVNVIGYKLYPFGSPLAQKHPGFQWSNANGAENSQNYQKQQVQSPLGYQNQNRGQQNFRPYQQATPYQQRPQQGHPSPDDLLYKYIKVTDEKMKSQNSALKNLEIQLSQLATLVSEKIQGPLPNNTEKNPKEHLKAIVLRSGTTLDEPYANKQEKNQLEQQVGKGENVETFSQPSEEKESKKKEEKNTKNLTSFPVTIPFPQKMKREKLDNQFAKFLEI